MKPMILSVFLSLMLITSAFSQQNAVSIKDKYGNQLLLQMNKRAGSAHRVYGLLPNINRYGFQQKNLNQTSVMSLSGKFFSDYSSILNIDPAQTVLSKAETDGKMWFVSYMQSHNNVPVYGTEIGYTINQNGDVVALGADAFTNITISTTPQITKSDAEAIANSAFVSDSTTEEKECKLIIYPKDEKDTTILHLAWEITLSRLSPLQEIVYFIDAQQGGIIDQKSNILEGSFSGQVTGNYWPIHSYDSPVQTGFKTTHVKVYNYLGQMVADVSSDANGNYSTGSFAYSYYIVQFTLQNEWVQSRDAANGGNAITQSLGWYTPPATVNENWGATDGTSARWLTSVMHDFYKNNFNYTAMDYQMGAYVNEGSGTNGGADGTNIMFGSQSGQYWARSSDVVYHEYTHNTIYHIYGGWIGTGTIESASMDEGLSDYYACTVNNDPIQGEDVGVSRNLSNTYHFDPNQPDPTHWNGQVIGGACWDLRQSSGVGSTVGNNLVFRALQVSPHAHNYSDFEYNVFVADNNYYSHSHTSQITQAFANHGISVPVFAITISGPTHLSISQTGTYTATASNGVSPYTYQWYAMEIGSGGAVSPLIVIPNRPPIGYWYATGTNSPTINFADSWDFELKCVVTDAIGRSATSNILYVTVGGSAVIAAKNTSQNAIVVQEIPLEYSLGHNYPNPFNPSTEFRFDLPESGYVTLTIYDMLGRVVNNLADGEYGAGTHSVRWYAVNRASGMYIARITIKDANGNLKYLNTQKLSLMK